MFLALISGLGTFSTRDRGCYLAQVVVGANPILPFLEDLAVCDVYHVASRALISHRSCHELRPAHSVGFALTKRAHPAAYGLEAIHEPLTVAFPGVQGLPKTV